MQSHDAGHSVPRATYRVQLHSEFGFEQAAALAEYLAELGVSHLYCSPYLQAAQGSTHGYDVVDHRRVNEELGGDAGHDRLCQALRKQRLGQVLDIVPNHMSIAERNNTWWWDVLENGPSSRYAPYFDVDWQSPEAKLQNTILMPILGDHYGRVLEADEFRLKRQGGSFLLRYHEHALPLSPRSIDELLRRAAQRYHSEELAFLADCCARLPLSTATDRQSLVLRHRDKDVIRRLIERLCRDDIGVAATIDAVLTEITFDHEALGALLDRQNYRLAFWRTAGQEVDYRRFFDITSLVSLRVEDEQVFADTHALVLQWVASGALDGLRVDHPDGLRDPQEYFDRLRHAAPQAWIVAEKILGADERLPAGWAVDGTTGYDFLNLADRLFIDPAGESALTEFYAEFTGHSIDFPAIVREKKHRVLRELFASDVNRLVALLGRVCEAHRRYRDHTRREMQSMLRETIACFPVYRSYVRAEAGQISDDDRRHVVEALDAARSQRPDVDGALFDLLGDILLLKLRGEAESELVMRFQQLTGPVMAKGVEDTALYCFNRLVSLNEVGGRPDRFGVSVSAFHQSCQEALQFRPRSMLATTTHDTKRSEDVRARLHLLSEIPERWAEAVRNWTELSQPHRLAEFQDRNTEYFLYQTLVGAWPIELERVLPYLEKGVREAKTHTSWTNPVVEYETALRQFVTSILRDAAFVESLESFVAPLVQPGYVNSLALTLLKLTAPGVPDIYQGTELWARTLVDPDNRRPVDFELRRRLLAELPRLTPEEIWSRCDEGIPKLWLHRQALALRRERPAAFDGRGGYREFAAHGERAEHVVAYARGDQVICIAPRWPLRLQNDWRDTALELGNGIWTNVLTGDDLQGTVLLANILHRFPVALLALKTG